MSNTTLPVHSTLIDPATGEPLEALAVIGGRPVWPVMGGSGEDEDADQDDEDDDEDPESDADADADADQDDDPKSSKGKRVVRKKNQENQSLRKRLQAAEDRLKEIDDAKKTDGEKTAERIAELEKQAADVPRLRVALRKGLTERQAARLVGDTEEDLEADADELLAELGRDDDTSRTDRTEKVKTRPRTRLKGGTRPEEEPDETDPRKLAAKVARRGGGRGF